MTPDFSPDHHEPLNLSQADIEEFKVLMRQECGVELENQEAWNRAIELISLYRMLIGPLPEDPEADQVAKPAQSSVVLSAPPAEVTRVVPEPLPPPSNLPSGQLSLGL